MGNLCEKKNRLQNWFKIFKREQEKSYFFKILQNFQLLNLHWF